MSSTSPRRLRLAALTPRSWPRFAAAAVLFGSAAAHGDETCTPLGQIVASEGTVQLSRHGGAWVAAAPATPLCAGDRVWVHRRSRAALRLDNETTLRLDQSTVFTLAPPSGDRATLLDDVKGGLHIITRTPQPYRVRTPFVNASIEGTEFEVRVTDDSARIAVSEGRIAASNNAGVVRVAAGEEAVATSADVAPHKAVTVRPKDAVAWTLYFPSLFNLRALGAGADTADGGALGRSVAHYRRGEFNQALAALDETPEAPAAGHGAQRLVYRAALLLGVGRVDEARPLLEPRQHDPAAGSDASALLASIAIVQNDKARGAALAEQALALNPQSAAAWLARSYAEQAQLRVDLALASAERAVGVEPGNALAWARLAEMRLSAGRLDDAVAAARAAVERDGGVARAHTVLGFAHLASADAAAAALAFGEAIRLDAADPLPRLGLGLAKIRRGDLAAGRSDIEIAVSLDPERSLARSYLGKAYFEERRTVLAGPQFDLAKQLDPQDPTPWYYDAIRKQSANRPVDALADLAESSARNQNRAVNRSQLLLDNDTAIRDTHRARTYNDLGFEQLEVVEAVKSLVADRSDASSHRYLSDYYATQPRHQLARDSELLQAQLLQTAATSPVFPQLARDGLNIFSTPLASAPGLDEYGRAFERDGLRLTTEVGGGERGYRQGLAVVSGLLDRLSFSVGAFDFQTDGFRANNRQRQTIGNAFAMLQLSPTAAVQVELRESKKDTGDPGIMFFSDTFMPTLRYADDRRSFRLGLRLGTGPDGTLLATYSRRRLDVSAAERSFFGHSSNIEQADLFELSHLWRHVNGTLRSGLSAYHGHLDTAYTPLSGGTLPGAETVKLAHAHLYGDWRLSPGAAVQLGAAYDRLDTVHGIQRRRVNPKLGLVLNAGPRTTIRAALMDTVNGPITSGQTLQPTEVAGFNQFFDGDEGVQTRRTGVAIDHVLNVRHYVGAEWSQRKLTRIAGPGGRETRFNERLLRAYYYAALTSRLVLAIDPQHLHQQGEPDGFNDQLLARSSTWRLPMQLRWFDESGWFARLRATYVRQSGRYWTSPFDPTIKPGQDRFWTVDVGLGYRLPERRGIFEIGIRNLADARFHFQDVDLRNPTIARRRLGSARLVLFF